MAKYLAMRIKQGKLNYEEVVFKYPQYQSDIDSILDEVI